MMRSMKVVVLAMTVAIFTGASALAESQTTCPVMGGKINKKIFADHDGKRVYFCCPMCVKKFKKNPEKSIKKLEDQGVTLETTLKPQTTCPLMGCKTDDKTCRTKFDDGPIKCTGRPGDQGIALKKIQATCPLMGSKTDDKTCWTKSNDGSIKCTRKPGDQGIALKEIQTTCPLMGGKINKKIFADHDGKRVYFCCRMCVKKFEKDPAKYIKKLEDQGITLGESPGKHHKGMSHRGSESK